MAHGRDMITYYVDSNIIFKFQSYTCKDYKSALSTLFLRNQLVNFDQTYTQQWYLEKKSP